MKFLNLSLIFLILFGCGAKKLSNSLEIPIKEYGLTVNVPQEWEKTESLFPSLKGQEKDRFMEVIFNFVPQKTAEQAKILEQKGTMTQEKAEELTKTLICLFKVTAFFREGFEETQIENFTKCSYNKAIGKTKNYIYFFSYNTLEEMDISTEDQENFATFYKFLDLVEGSIDIYEPIKPKSSSLEFLEFSSVDLEGKTVTSKIFEKNRLTLVNFWGTYCAPCIDEMPELGKIAQEYEGLGVLGIVIDGTGNQEIAKKILSKSKATFTNILVSQELQSGILQTIKAVPTTIFVDSKGKIVGNRVVGAQIEEYKRQIEAFLK